MTSTLRAELARFDTAMVRKPSQKHRHFQPKLSMSLAGSTAICPRLEMIEQMAASEVAPVTLCFNGDFAGSMWTTKGFAPSINAFFATRLSWGM